MKVVLIQSQRFLEQATVAQTWTAAAPKFLDVEAFFGVVGPCADLLVGDGLAVDGLPCPCIRHAITVIH